MNTSVFRIGEGLIHRGDRLDYLTPAEHAHWMRNALPFGWSIVTAPAEPVSLAETLAGKSAGNGKC